jgi:type IV pilus assembly protein PilE
MRKRNAGVSLIELLTVIMIVGLLAGIAVPTYRNYTIRAHRADGKAAMLAMAGQLERCFTRFNSYDPDDGCAVVSGVSSTEGYYMMNITEQTAAAYAIEAVPQNGQEDDEKCGTFQLDSAGVKSVTGGDSAQHCWGK